MSFTTFLKIKPTQQTPNDSWEDKYPTECPLWLNIIVWSFVFVPFLFI